MEGKKGSYFLSPSRKQLLVLGCDEAGGEKANGRFTETSLSYLLVHAGIFLNPVYLHEDWGWGGWSGLHGPVGTGKSLN